MFTRDQLEAMLVDELHELASAHGVVGHSSMIKAELVDALLEIPAEDSPTGSAIDDRVSDLEARVASLEARLQAIDDRTVGSTMILGSAT